MPCVIIMCMLSQKFELRKPADLNSQIVHIYVCIQISMSDLDFTVTILIESLVK